MGWYGDNTGPQASRAAAPTAMQQSPMQQPPGLPPSSMPAPSADPPVLEPTTQPMRRRRRRRRILVVVSIVLVLALAAGGYGGWYYFLRTIGTPQLTAASYLKDWNAGNYAGMGKVSLNVPSGGLAGPLTTVKSDLGVKTMTVTLGKVTTTGSTARAAFTVTDQLASGHTWTYSDQLSLLKKDRHWWVNWSMSAIYPHLQPGQRFALSAVWPSRANIVSSDGTVLSSPGAISASGSLALLVGYLGKATAKEAKALGKPYKKGDLIGLSGLEQTYQKRLAGKPAQIIKIVGPGHKVDATAMRFAAIKGKPVTTSIDMSVQHAASEAVLTAKTNKPIDMVAIQPSTGKILAVVESPGGFDRALEGIFPPGSTFKIVTASALVRGGLTSSSTVQCPAKVDIDGRTFHNDANEHLGSTSLLNAFAISCNTTFALLATEKLSGPLLGAMARNFGYNSKPALGIPATLGSFQPPKDAVDLAADAFGQGLDLVNPLSQASEAGAIDSGVWRPPLLVTSPVVHQKARPHVIDSTILDALRPMMRAVVTSGTAAGVGFGDGVYGKTGTAEYGTGPHPKSHGWFIGYSGDVAFAVLVEGGGFGADSAGPIANAFLHRI